MDNKEIILHGHIHSESDFEITVHLPNSGMIIDLKKRDIINHQAPNQQKD